MDIRASRSKSGNDAYDDIVDAFDEIVDLVHSEDGWTVYGWGKIFLVKDVSLLGNDIKAPGNNKVSQENRTYVVNLHPPKKDYLKLSTIYGRSIGNLKFDLYTP